MFSYSSRRPDTIFLHAFSGVYRTAANPLLVGPILYALYVLLVAGPCLKYGTNSAGTRCLRSQLAFYPYYRRCGSLLTATSGNTRADSYHNLLEQRSALHPRATKMNFLFLKKIVCLRSYFSRCSVHLRHHSHNKKSADSYDNGMKQQAGWQFSASFRAYFKPNSTYICLPRLCPADHGSAERWQRTSPGGFPPPFACPRACPVAFRGQGCPRCLSNHRDFQPFY